MRVLLDNLHCVSPDLDDRAVFKLGPKLPPRFGLGQTHAGVIAPSANDMIGCIADRFAVDPLAGGEELLAHRPARS